MARDPLARTPAADTCAHLEDGARELVPGDQRQPDVVVVARERVPVAAAQPGGLDPDDHAVGCGARLGHLAHDGRHPELLDDDGAHEAILTRRGDDDAWPLNSRQLLVQEASSKPEECPRGELNPHVLSDTATSTLRVCHSATRTRARRR